MKHKDNKDCGCSGCQSAKEEQHSRKELLDMINVILKHGGKMKQDEIPPNIIKLDFRNRDRKIDLYNAMMDDAGIPISDRR